MYPNPWWLFHWNWITNAISNTILKTNKPSQSTNDITESKENNVNNYTVLEYCMLCKNPSSFVFQKPWRSFSWNQTVQYL